MLAALVGAASLVAGSWQAGPQLPVPRSEVAGTAVGREIVIVGGYLADGRSSKRVDAYSPSRRRWRRLPDLPVAVNHSMAASYRGRPYVLGGYAASGALRTAFVLSGRRWRRLPPMPGPRAAGGAVVVGSRLYVVGGVRRAGDLARGAFAFDLRRSRWAGVAGPTPREHLAVTALGGLVYAIAGRTAGIDTNLQVVEAFRPGAPAWQTLPPVPEARGGTAATAAGGRLISVGGEAPSGTIASVYDYDPGSRQWTKLPDLPTPRHGLAAVALGRRVYVIAGGKQPGLFVSGTNEALDVG